MSTISIEPPYTYSERTPLASRPPEPPDVEDGLRDAAKRGCLDDVRAHLDGGVAVDARDPVTGATALHLAVRSGHVEVAELLLLRGADPNARTSDGDAVLALARTFTPVPRLVAMLGLLRSHGAHPELGRW